MRGQRSTATAAGHAIGACTACGTILASEGVEEGVSVACSHCGATVTLKQVYGNMTQFPCDGRCMGAVGPYCECGCGGTNHGCWFLNIELVPSWVAQAQARARDRHAQVRKSRADRERSEEARVLVWQSDMLARHPELARLGEELTPDERYAMSGFELDMRRAWAAGRMTDRQIEATVRMYGYRAARKAREERWAAEEAAARAAGVTVPSGRGTYMVTVISTRVDETQYGAHARMLVKHESGWRAWGSVPCGVWNLVAPGRGRGYGIDAERDALDSVRGQRVSLTATWLPGEKDELAGTFKRPICDAAGGLGR